MAPTAANGRQMAWLRAAYPLLLGVAVLCPLGWGSAALAQVRATMTADRTQIGLHENVVLRIEVEAEGMHSPDIGLPSLDAFEVVSQQMSRPLQFSFSFGGRAQRMVRSTTVYTFVLRPYGTGRFVIKPVRVKLGDKAYQSKPLTIVVTTDSGGAAPRSQPAPEPNASEPSSDDGQASSGFVDGARFDREAFLRTVVDKAEVVVGEQVTVTIYLYLRGRLSAVPAVEAEPSTDGFWIYDLLSPTRKLEATRQLVGGRMYRVYVLKRFAAFPLRSGELVLGPMKVRVERGSLFDIFTSGGSPTLQRTGQSVTIVARDLPERGKPPGEVAVGRFQLSAKLDREQAPTGDAVTLTATVRGAGNLKTVRLPTPNVEGLQVLQPEIRDMVEAPDDLVGGTRVFEWLLVPRRPGRFEIGPLALSAFDPSKGSYVPVASQPLTLVAVGKALDREATGEVALSQGQPEKGEQRAYQFGPVRTSSALKRGRTRVLAAPWYPWVVALGPAAWLMLVTGSFVRRQLASSSAKSAPRRAAREASRRLSKASGWAQRGDASRFYAEVAAAMKALLEAKLAEPVGGFTHPELRAHLVGRGMRQELAAAVTEELDNCDMARFSSAGGDPDEMKRCAERARKLFRQLAGFVPGPGERAR